MSFIFEERDKRRETRKIGDGVAVHWRGGRGLALYILKLRDVGGMGTGILQIDKRQTILKRMTRMEDLATLCD